MKKRSIFLVFLLMLPAVSTAQNPLPKGSSKKRSSIQQNGKREGSARRFDVVT